MRPWLPRLTHGEQYLGEGRVSVCGPCGPCGPCGRAIKPLLEAIPSCPFGLRL